MPGAWLPRFAGQPDHYGIAAGARELEQAGPFVNCAGLRPEEPARYGEELTAQLYPALDLVALEDFQKIAAQYESRQSRTGRGW